MRLGIERVRSSLSKKIHSQEREDKLENGVTKICKFQLFRYDFSAKVDWSIFSFFKKAFIM